MSNIGNLGKFKRRKKLAEKSPSCWSPRPRCRRRSTAMPLTFNQTTALLGALYVVALFWTFSRLKAVWAREAANARLGLALFVVLFLAASGSGAYTYYTYRKKRLLERKAASLIQRAKDKPLEMTRTNMFGRGVKIFSALLLTFISIHRIMRNT